MLKTVSVTALKPGMFVQSIAKQSGSSRYNLKKPGRVPNQQTIELLKSRGVIAVAVDPSKSEGMEAEPAATPQEQAPSVPSFQDQTGTASLEEEMERATKLYSEAKDLQQKALNDILAGEAIEMDSMEQMTEAFIDSVFRNHDALLCLTRIREKDAYLLEHSINVSILMAIFAKHLGIERKIMHEICLGALMHDLGKIKIPEQVLHKPGRLTEDEFDLMKRHVLFSQEVILESGARIPRLTMEVVMQHHEKLNGSGYPFGLHQDKISKYGRMVSIVDIYDALTADRCYKRGMVPNAALGILQGLASDQLDTDLVYEFIRCMSLYPVGTLVKLESGRLGIVVETNEKELTKPKVKVFYHTKYQHHIEVKIIDLARPNVQDSIASCEKPEKHNVDITKYF